MAAKGEVTLLHDASQGQAFLKCGLLGFAGSGKTFTASTIAIGLHKYAKLKKPVAFLDTETGSDFMVARFNEAKVDLKVLKSRSFIDCIGVIKEAEKSCSILVLDSITHIWMELMESYMKKYNLKRLLFQHWAPIKQEWRQLTDLYVESNLHIIMCGRAGWEYDFVEDSEDGTRELVKLGTKMKSETEMSYEPSLLMEMQRVRTEEGKIGGSHIHRCWVLKDRADKINGKYFDDPGFDVFLPHIDSLALGGKHTARDTERSSETIFPENESSGHYKRKQIALELIQNELVIRYPNTIGDDRVAKLQILSQVFQTHSWKKIETMDVETLERGASAITKMKKPTDQPAAGASKGETTAAGLAKAIADIAVANNLSVKKFLGNWSGGKIMRLSELSTTDLQTFLEDIKKYISKKQKEGK